MVWISRNLLCRNSNLRATPSRRSRTLSSVIRPLGFRLQASRWPGPRFFVPTDLNRHLKGRRCSNLKPGGAEEKDPSGSGPGHQHGRRAEELAHEAPGRLLRGKERPVDPGVVEAEPVADGIRCFRFSARRRRRSAGRRSWRPKPLRMWRPQPLRLVA